MDFLFTLFVFIFIAIILYQIMEFLKNESAPEISVPATLVEKEWEVAVMLMQMGFLINQLPTIFYLNLRMEKE